MRTPSFWYRDRPSTAARFLVPLALVWLAGGWLKAMLSRRHTSRFPVVCVGNITVGGTGKTPMVSVLAEAASARGFKPVVLTRGHGGKLRGPASATGGMTAEEVGDEARMLCRTVPVVIAENRAEGAAFIESNMLGDLILMDDGMQSRQLKKDRQVAVFSGRLGIGNGLPVPAGPMRERLAGLTRADAVVVTGEDRTELIGLVRERFPDLPVFHTGRKLHSGDVRALAGQAVVAFAGTGDPEGFFSMLEEAGVNIAARVPLADHEPLTKSRMAELRELARKHEALLATTEKDAARLDRREDLESVRAVRLETRLDASLADLVLAPFGKGAGQA